MMNRQAVAPAATTWGAGEYELMATKLDAAAEAAVRRAEITIDDRVLDVGCGTGNVALRAAESARHVVGVDLEPSLLQKAQARADAKQSIAKFVNGDACALPFPDQAFTAVISVFGAMYAPDQGAAAGELSRMCASGGRVVLTAWLPDSFMPLMGRVVAPYLPPAPPGASSPTTWGSADQLTSLLARAGLVVRTQSSEDLQIHLDDRATAVDFLIRTAGNVVGERDRITRNGQWSSLLRDLRSLVDRQNEAAGPGVELHLAYLITVAVPR